jgi:hypothetical protein
VPTHATVASGVRRGGRRTGDTRDRIRVTGTGNTLDGNKTNANTGHGIYVLGPATNTKLKANQSNTGRSGSIRENTPHEDRLDAAPVKPGRQQGRRYRRAEGVGARDGRELRAGRRQLRVAH